MSIVSVLVLVFVLSRDSPSRSIFTPSFVIRDQTDQVVLRIEGPFCTFSICGDVKFRVLTPDGSNEVGEIRYG